MKYNANKLKHDGDVAHMVERSLHMRDVWGSIPGLIIFYCYGWFNESNIENLWLFYFRGHQSTSNGGELGKVVVKVGGSITLWSFRISTRISRVTCNKGINFEISQGHRFQIHNDNALQIFFSTELPNIQQIFLSRDSRRLRCLLGVYLREVRVRCVLLMYKSIHHIII